MASPGVGNATSSNEQYGLRPLISDLAMRIEDYGSNEDHSTLYLLQDLAELVTQESLDETGRQQAAEILLTLEGLIPSKFVTPKTRDSFTLAGDQLADPSFKLDTPESLNRLGSVRLFGLEPELSPKSIDPGWVTPLEHGGLLLIDGEQSILFGASPVAVTDVMRLGASASMVVIDEGTLMDWIRLHNLGEGEFAMYYLFFFKSGMTEAATYLTTERVAPHLDMILRTSYEGPQWGFKNADLAPEYPQGEDTPGFPNMEGELAHFGGISIDKMRKVVTFQNGVFQSGDIRIVNLGDSTYRVFKEEAYLGDIDLKTMSQPVVSRSADLAMLQDPRFQAVRQRVLFDGESMLIPISSSHGTDPTEGTSGHAIFNDGRGILVDPPADILDFLAANQIPASAIDGVILTHVHADHDQGALQVFQANGAARLYTTRSIRRMFVDKLEALSLGRFGRESIKSLWEARDLTLLQPTEINGLTFHFYHTLHAIPAIGFNILDSNGRAVVSYSGDTLNDPRVVYKLLDPVKEGASPVISSLERAIHITELPLSALRNAGGVAIHEAGGGIIHTSTVVLEAAQRVYNPANGGGRLLAYHLSAADAARSGLEKWGSGFSHAIELRDTIPSTRRTSRENILRALQGESLFYKDDIDIEMLERLAGIGRVELIPTGHTFITEGTMGKRMYLMLDGDVDVRVDGVGIVKRTKGWIGEGALLGKPRNASAIAKRPTLVYVVDADEHHDVLEESGLKKAFDNLTERRTEGFAPLSRSPLMEGAHGDVIDGLLQIARKEPYRSGQRIIEQGVKDRSIFFILSGDAYVNRNGTNVNLRSKRDFVGEMAYVTGEPRNANVIAAGDVEGFWFDEGSLDHLAARVPNVKLRFMALAAERQGKNESVDAARLGEHEALLRHQLKDGKFGERPFSISFDSDEFDRQLREAVGEEDYEMMKTDGQWKEFVNVVARATEGRPLTFTALRSIGRHTVHRRGYGGEIRAIGEGATPYNFLGKRGTPFK